MLSLTFCAEIAKRSVNVARRSIYIARRSVILSFLIAESGPCELILYTAAQVEARLRQFDNVPRYNTVLRLGQPLPVSPEPPGRTQSRSTRSAKPSAPTNEETQKVLEEAHIIGNKVHGRVPPQYPKLRKFGSRGGEVIYGLSNHEDLSRLMEYLYMNGNYELVPVQAKGACMFASVRRGIDTPKEYTNTHTRRQLTMTVTEYMDFFFELLKNSILGQYGHDRMPEEELRQKELAGEVTEEFAREQRLPGPFSFLGFLRYMLKEDSWGDETTLTLLSMMWQVRITVVYAETLIQERIRHDLPLTKADIVVVLCGRRHYCGAGEYRSPRNIYRSPRNNKPISSQSPRKKLDATRVKV